MQRNRWWRNCVAVAALHLATMVPVVQGCRAQNITIVSNTKIYSESVARDPDQQMIELHRLTPGIVYDLRYATKNNFTAQKLYREGGRRTYLRLQPARALAAVQDSLEKKGLGLKIFDAYRPHAATRLMWELVHDERYVANPAKGSGHNRGLAVDLTIVDSNGKELDMGTGFDNFTDTAHSDFRQLPAAVLANRQLLRGIMEAKGFTVLPTEWWHFYWPNNRQYEVLDLSFRELRKGMK